MAFNIIDPRLWIPIGYKRRSREDVEAERDGKHETLAKQHRLLEFIAKEEYNLEIVEWFEEIASGETISGRPEFRMLLHYLMKDKWEAKKKGKRMALFVKEASRLGRGSGADRDRIINVIKASKTYVVTPDKIYDPESSKDLKLLKKELEDATDEKDASVERMQKGIIRSIEEGCYLYRKPYGWNKVRNEKRQWTLEANEEEQERLLIMIDLIVKEDMKLGDVKKYCEKNEWKSPTGKKYWAKATLNDILSSRTILRGGVSHGKHATIETVDEDTFDSSKSTKTVTDFLQADGLHDPLISEELFQALQRKIHGRYNNYRDRGLQNYYSGILVCGKCGFAMIRHPYMGRRYGSVKSEGKPYVRFEHSENHDCDCKGAPWYDVEEAIIYALQAKYASYELMLTDEGKQRDRERVEKRVRALEADLKKAETQLNNAYDMRESGEYTRGQFEDRRAILTNRIKTIEESIEKEMMALPVEDEELAMQMVTVSELIETLRDETVDNYAKNMLLREWIDRIEYFNDAPPRVRYNELRLVIFFVWDTTS